MGRTRRKGERTMTTLNTPVVRLLIVYLIYVVSCESAANPVQPTIRS